MTDPIRPAREIYLAAVRMPPDRWDAYLAEVCGGDDALQRQVRALLDAHRQAGNVPESLALGEAATLPEIAYEQPGTVIGPYKLIQKLGEGGMGTVYMAQQSEPVKRLTALKVIKPGMDSRQVIARFEAERQALALMDHPNIAKVFDAGTFSDPAGRRRPYFVMELVKGLPMTKYCDEQRLTPRQRLELFVSVCHAVQHAHQKGVIHRDLKPSNVLVALYDGRAVAKVIDFGVAKAAGQQLTDKTLVTEFGALVGTVEYMSPEQAELNNLDVDSRSDIYSLGVLLYELLTGTTPLERKRLKEKGLLEALRIIREEETPRPSTRLSTAEELPRIAACRSVEPGRLSGLVRGELDWIVMKALEKDRSRRYDTAGAFADDVQRYLNDEPVAACPPSASYRVRKFARRYRVPLGAAAAVAAVVLLAVAALAFNYAQLRQEQEKTKTALAAETKANDELQEVIRRERRNLYDYAFDLARRSWLAGDIEQARLNLQTCPPELRDHDWDHLHRACHAEALRIDALAPHLVYSPDGKLLAGNAAGLTVWEAAGGKELTKLLDLDTTAALTFNRDGSEVVSVTSGEAPFQIGVPPEKRTTPGFRVTITDAKTGKFTFPFTRNGERGEAALSADGSRVVLVAWNLNTSWPGLNAPKSVTVYETRTGRELCTLAVPKGQTVMAVAFLPDGRIVTRSGRDSVLRFWDADTGKALREAPLPGATLGSPFAISPDGKRVVTVTSNPPNVVKVSDLETGRELATLTGHGGIVSSLAFSRDGRWLATGATDNAVMVWDMGSGQQVVALRGHTSGIYQVVFRPDGTRLASSSSDKTIRIWDLTPFQQ